MNTRKCYWCSREIPEKSFCDHCQDEFPNRRAPHLMTPDERVSEMQSLGVCEVAFAMIHARIESLVGRPVWTHEMGLNWSGLLQECRWKGRPATMDEIIDLVPAEKRIVI